MWSKNLKALVRSAAQMGGVAVVASSPVLFANSARADGWFGSKAANAPLSTSTATSPATQNAAAFPPRAFDTEFDVVVVGGGIIGLATAKEILKRYPHMTVAVIEKEREVAPHQSGHNSGVIHAGIYYEPGSVMAKTCVRGADLMYEYCAKHNIPHERVGKLIVATTAEEDKIVDELFRRATLNGVKGLAVLTPSEIVKMEPNIVGTSALWSPNTGIADFGAVTRSLADEIIKSGQADVKLQFEVLQAKKRDDGWVEIQGVEPGQVGPKKIVKAKNVITCGGLYADRLGRIFGGAEDPKIVVFRGTYYQLKPAFRNLVHTNVYPVPSGGGIPVGVHFTPTCNERRGKDIIIGPGACIAFAREGYRMKDISIRDMLDYALNGGLWRFALANPQLSIGELWKDFNKNAFLRAAQKLMPGLTADLVEESFAGCMSQVFDGQGKAAKDFIFERGTLGGTTMNVRNAPSPAATSAFAIAEHVVNIAEEDFSWKSAPLK